MGFVHRLTKRMKSEVINMTWIIINKFICIGISSDVCPPNICVPCFQVETFKEHTLNTQSIANLHTFYWYIYSITLTPKQKLLDDESKLFNCMTTWYSFSQRTPIQLCCLYERYYNWVWLYSKNSSQITLLTSCQRVSLSLWVKVQYW